MKKQLLSGLAALCMLPLIVPVSAEPSASEISASTQAAPVEDRIYCLASVSKVYTTAAIMQFADEGKLSLDDSITKYLPDLKMEDERYKDITVRMLLNHTLGMNNGGGGNDYLFGDTDSYLHDNALSWASSQRFKADPGEYASYSNMGFMLAELVIESVSGMSYTDYIRQNIAAKVGADHTGTGWSIRGTDMEAMQVPLYSIGRNRTAYPYEMALGTGGIYSTARDVANFGAAFFTGNDVLLSENAKNEMRTRWTDDEDQENYGLGWDFVSYPKYEDAGVNVVGKGGDEPYMHSFLLVAPDEQISTAVLTSGDVTSNFPMLAAEALMDVVLEEQGIEVTDTAASEPQMLDAVPAEQKQHEGMYVINAELGMGIYLISFDDTMMYRQQLGYDRSEPDRYRPTADGTFVKVTESGKMTADREIVRFDEINGRTYIKTDETTVYPGLGSTWNSLYAGEKIDENPVPDAVQASWDKAANTKFVLFNEKWSAQDYESPFGRVMTDESFPGYVISETRGSIVERIVDEDTAHSFSTIPSSRNRDQHDVRFFDYTFADGTAVRAYQGDDAKIFRDTAGLPVFTMDISEVKLTDGEASWYRISKDIGSTSITAERPMNSAIYVYDRFGKMVWNSFLRDIPPYIPLPADGFIVFIGESGGTVNILR